MGLTEKQEAKVPFASSMEESNNPFLQLEAAMEDSFQRVGIEKQHSIFQHQDEFIVVKNLFSEDLLQQFLLPHLDPLSKFIHRNYIPMHKKSGSIASRTLEKQAPIFHSLYNSPSLRNFLNTLTEHNLLVCPNDDAHSVALYFYTEEGDHIGYHYDSSFYKGLRYTVLLGLVDEDSDCELVVHLYKDVENRKTEILNLKVDPGTMIIFNGDKIWHKVTPLGLNQKRVMLSMEFLTTQDIGTFGKTVTNLKDAVTYFGIGSLFGHYKGDAPNETKQISQTSSWSASWLGNQDEQPLQETNILGNDPTKPHMIAFINKISGGQRGSEVLEKLRTLLGSSNVFDLNEDNGPERGLSIHKDVKNLKIVVGGGDGTVRWVVQGMVDSKFFDLDNLPHVGVLPLGTGNDLSRMVGMGSGYQGEKIRSLLVDIKFSKPRAVDLWECKTSKYDPSTQTLLPNTERSQVMFNYWNIGYDAQVANGFHTHRKQNPSLFLSRLINKLWYIWYAIINFFVGSPNLDENLQLEIDDQPVEIPNGIKTIVVLNFVAYQAGVDIWGPDTDKTNIPTLDDGLVEVVGIGGFVHETLIRTFLTSGYRLGRGKKVKLTSKKPNVALPVAFDGEPELVDPFVTTIQRTCQISVCEKQ